MNEQQPVSKMNQSNTLLDESEEQSRRLIEFLPNGVIVHSGGKIVSANPAALDIFGAKAEELIGTNLMERVHPDYRGAVRERVQESMVRGIKAETVEEKLLRMDGTTFYAEVTGLAFTYAGQPAMLAVFADVTERKKAQEALRSANEILQAVLDVSPLAVIRMDVERRVQFWNDAAEHIFGWTKEEVIGKPNPIVPLEKYEEFLALNNAVMGKGRMVNQELIRQRKDGSLVNVSLSSAGLYDSTGKPRGSMAIIADVTERVQAEEAGRDFSIKLQKTVEERTRELRAAQEQLIRQERLAVLGQLAGGVGHELRNPLAVMAGAVYFIKHVQADADERIKKHIGILENEIDNADKIITDLLDFSRIKSVDREPVNASELVRRALERYPVPEHITVSLDLSADLPPVYADPRQVVQVLGNLITNACQAMPEQGNLTIKLEHFEIESKPMVGIFVIDTGAGILPEYMSKLFEPLFTTKPRGIGLGLAVCKKLVDANGGRIEVQSEPGKGATFKVFFPAHQSLQ
jgi:PAS domain S-box-containing protein